MKFALVKTCPGSGIAFYHDSSKCVRCLRTKSFYNEFQPALQKLKKVTDDPILCGIITFLGACFKCEVLSEDEKVDLVGQVSKLDFFSNSIPDDLQKQINNYHLLDGIPGVKLKKNLKKLAYCSSRLNALKYKYGAKAKRRGKKNGFEDVFEKPHCSGKKRKTVKPKPKKSKRKDPAKIPTKGTLKRKRWYMDKLSKGNDHHEDDIFEDKPLFHLHNLDEIQFLPPTCFQLPKNDKISSSSSDYSNVGTPTWSFALSPRGSSPTPEYDDFYDATELQITRKAAEEYQHRRKKRKQQFSKNKNLESDPPPAKVTAKDLDEPPEDLSQPPDDLSRPSCSYEIGIPPCMEASCCHEIVIPPCKEEKDYDSDEVSDDYFPFQ